MEYIRFDSPVYIFAGACIAVLAWLYRKRYAVSPEGKKPVDVLRFVIICLIFAGLAEPQLLTMTYHKCVLFVADVSQSIDEKEKKAVGHYITMHMKEKRQNDRTGVLLFGEDANLVIPPSDISIQALLSDVSGLMESYKAGSGFTNLEGALLTASKVFPAGFQKRIVLITDGNENSGNVSGLLDTLASMDIIVNVLPVGGVDHAEVIVESVYAPHEVREGIPFPLEIAVSSNTAASGRMQVFIDGQKKEILNPHLEIVPELHQIKKYPVVIEKGGFHDISVTLLADQDGFYVNNSAETFTFAASRPKVLFITDPSLKNSEEPSGYLVNLMNKNNIDVERLPAARLPLYAKDYIGYEGIILNNVPSSSLLPEQMQAISSAVHDLGTGLVLVGGEQSIGSRGFFNTPVEAALPLHLIPSSGEGPSSMDLVLVMDKSGSMSEGAGSKIRSAVDSIHSIIELSGEADRTGVIAFDSSPHVIARPGSLNNREDILRKIEGITPRGSTDFYPALVMAYEWLKASSASHKHIILLSDGKTRERDFTGLVRNIRDRHITISVIGIGRDSNAPLMKEIAQMGKGRFFQVEDEFHKLSEIFRIDTLMAAGVLSVEDSFFPRLKDPDVILKGVPLRMPMMNGYMVTSPKNTAIIPVVSHRGDPIVGFWRYGLGKAAVFTGDDGSRWSRDLILWDGFGRLWVQLVKRTVRSGTEQDEHPVFRVKGNSAEIQYEIFKNASIPPMNITAKILPPEGAALNVTLFRYSDRIYRGSVDNLAPGKYITVISADISGSITVLFRGSFTIKGSQEFLTLDKDETLLKEIAFRTGGRILTKEDPLFEDKGKGMKQLKQIRPYFFILAVILFLVNTAFRRILKKSTKA